MAEDKTTDESDAAEQPEAEGDPLPEGPQSFYFERMGAPDDQPVKLRAYVAPGSGDAAPSDGPPDPLGEGSPDPWGRAVADAVQFWKTALDIHALSDAGWTQEPVSLYARSTSSNPDVVRRDVEYRIGAAAGDPEAADWLVGLHHEALRQTWLQRWAPPDLTVGVESNYKQWLTEVEAGVGSMTPEVEDRDILVLASCWQIDLDSALRRAGEAVLHGGERRREIDQLLRDSGEERAAAAARARKGGLDDSDLDKVAACLGFGGERWVTPDGMRVTGLPPREEAAVVVGRWMAKQGGGRSRKRWRGTALESLLEYADEQNEALEAFRASREWSGADAALLAEARRRDFHGIAGELNVTHEFIPAPKDGSRELLSKRGAAIELGKAAEGLRPLRRRIQEQQHIRMWLRAEERLLLLVAWEGKIAPEGPEGVAKYLAEDREGELLVLRERAASAAAKALADAVHGHDAGGRPVPLDLAQLPPPSFELMAAAWTDQHYRDQDWSVEDVREYVGASVLLAGMDVKPGISWTRPGQILGRFMAMVNLGLLPPGLRDRGWRLADVAEYADVANHEFHLALEKLSLASTESDPARAVFPGWGVDVPLGEALDAARAARTEGGRDEDACLAAFRASRHWHDDDAQFLASLRGISEDDAAEWIGHCLLKGREEDLAESFVDYRVEEQSYYRTETTGKPYVILVLQGGGAKAAYQVGVFEALDQQGLSPSWVLGISSGALNAAAIAGSPVSERMATLERMWGKLTNTWEMSSKLPKAFENMAKLSGAFTQLMRKPNFYKPHGLPSEMFPPGSDGATSSFDNTPLREMLQEVVDFGRIRREAEIYRRTRWSRRRSRTPARVTVGTTKVRTGEFVWWDSADTSDFGVEHVLASGAMPPGAPAVELEDELYWDGGVVANNPLEPVLEEMINGNLNGREVLVVFVDLWGSEDWVPLTKKAVEVRQQQLDFMGRVDASISQFNLRLRLELEKRRTRGVDELLTRPWRPRRRSFGAIDPRSLTLLRIENGRRPPLGKFDAMDFSASSIASRRAAGKADTLAALEASDWRSIATSGDLGGCIFHFRRGRLVGKSSAIGDEGDG